MTPSEIYLDLVAFYLIIKAMNKKVFVSIIGILFVVISVVSIDISAQTDVKNQSIPDMLSTIKDKTIREEVRKFQKDKRVANLNLDQIDALK